MWRTTDFATHETPSTGYEKQWDKAGWQQPQYGPSSAEEDRAGESRPAPQANRAILILMAHAVRLHKKIDELVFIAVSPVGV